MMKMFTNEVKERLNEILVGVEIETVDVTKDNDRKMTGLCIKSPGDVAPVFYMEDYIDSYQNGESIESIAKSIADLYLAADLPVLDLSWESIKDKITIRVLELSRNRNRVKNCPYVYLDAGFVGLADVVIGDGRAIITDDIMKTLPVDDAELFEIARSNIDFLHPVLCPLDSVLFGGAENLLISGEVDPSTPVYMLTAETGVYGASALFCGGMTRRIHSLIGAFYVLPSSVHEVLILPQDNAPSVDEMKTTLYTGNRTVCEEKDILSDNVLYFDGDVLRVV